jgi:hypothetical protein
MTTLDQHILHIMSQQVKGYLINPNAAAFVAAGLDDIEAIEESLKMLDKGLVEYIVEETDYERRNFTPSEDDPKLGTVEVEQYSEVTDFGWVLTEKGRKAI